MKQFLITALFILFSFVPFVGAQELHTNETRILHGQVEAVTREVIETRGPGGKESLVQDIRVRLDDGMTIQFQNDYLEVEVGDKVFINELYSIEGQSIYTLRDFDRRGLLASLGVLFIAVVLLFGGKQGFRSLASLAGSLFVIAYLLIPGLLAGYSPVLLSVGIAVLVLATAILITHGFNRNSFVALFGTGISIIITGLLSWFAVILAKFSGFASEEAVYVAIQSNTTLDFAGILLGGILIGALGVLDDIAITQVAVVREFREHGLSPRAAFEKALKVGREHVAALVNTLALAYTGAALPLLMLFVASNQTLGMFLNYEGVAVEIVRIVAGSIGLILSVPITTFLASRIKLSSENNHHHHHTHS